MSQRGYARQTAALLVGNAVGYSGPTSVPFWLANMSSKFHLSPAQAGPLVTLELLAVAASVIATSRLVGRISPRVAGCAGVVLAACGNALAYTAGSVGGLAAGLLLTGLGLGTLLGTVNVTAARRAQPQRILALMLLALVCFAVGFFSLAPRATGSLGPGAAFAILCGFCLVSLPFVAGLPARLPAAEQLDLPPDRLGPRAVMGGLALLALLGGQDCFWPFMQQIGARAGLDPGQTGLVLAVGALVNLAGPIAARLVGLRFGNVPPTAAGFCVMIAAAALLGQSRSQAAFALAAISLTTMTFFLVPYVMSLLAQLDRSGRLAGAGPALMMMGSAIAPLAAGAVVGRAGIAGLSYLTMSLFALGLVLFAAAAKERKQSFFEKKDQKTREAVPGLDPGIHV